MRLRGECSTNLSRYSMMGSGRERGAVTAFGAEALASDGSLDWIGSSTIVIFLRDGTTRFTLSLDPAGLPFFRGATAGVSGLSTRFSRFSVGFSRFSATTGSTTSIYYSRDLIDAHHEGDIGNDLKDIVPSISKLKV